MTTEPTPTTEAPARVVEPGQDPVDLLTVRELGMIAKRIGEDPVNAVQVPTGRRWEALALMGWALDRRRDQAAKADTWLDLPVVALVEALGLDDDPDAVAVRQAADDADPTAPVPER